MTGHRALRIASLVAVVLAGTAVLAHSAQTDDEYLGLPDAPGREEVVAYCAACHSLKLVVQQGQTREGWAELLEWMYDEQEMAELEPEEEKLVLDYLAKYVSPEAHRERLKARGILR